MFLFDPARSDRPIVFLPVINKIVQYKSLFDMDVFSPVRLERIVGIDSRFRVRDKQLSDTRDIYCYRYYNLQSSIIFRLHLYIVFHNICYLCYMQLHLKQRFFPLDVSATCNNLRHARSGAEEGGDRQNSHVCANTGYFFSFILGQVRLRHFLGRALRILRNKF